MNRNVRALIVTTLALSFSALSTAACGKTDAPAPEPGKPAQAAASTKSAQTAAPKPAAPKPAVKKSVPAEKKPHPVPQDWSVLVDTARGYGFAVPAGTRDHHESKDGVDIYVAEVPKPHDIQVFGVAYKDRTRTRADLLEQAKHVLELMDNKEVKLSNEKELSPDYALADATCKSDGKAWKVRVLVATDVTDNYILLVGSPESEFASNEATIDTIWGSFDMLSGGASGKSN